MHAKFAKFAQTDASPIAHCGSWPTDNAPRLASRPSKQIWPPMALFAGRFRIIQ